MTTYSKSKLNLSVFQGMFSLNMTMAGPMKVILTSSSPAASHVLLALNKDVNIYVSTLMPLLSIGPPSQSCSSRVNTQVYGPPAP